MDGKLNSLQILSSSNVNKRSNDKESAEIKKKRLSLNKSALNCGNSECFTQASSQETVKRPLQTLISEDNFPKILSKKVEFLGAVTGLNAYNKKLLKSLEESAKENIMSCKKTTAKRVRKKCNNNDTTQRTLLSYFKAQKSNSTCDTMQNVSSSRTSKSDSRLQETRNSCNIISTNSKTTDLKNGSELFIDLCDSSSSSSFEDTFSNKKQSQLSLIEKTTQIQSSVIDSSENMISAMSRSSNFRIFTELKSNVSQKTLSTRSFKRSSTSFSEKKIKKLKECPAYKLIKDTPFAVDAFSYGDIPGIEVYFLTHFHSDHYAGLNKSFNKPLYCTKITSELCQLKLRVNSSCINILEVDTTMDIRGVQVTAVDANHCPGSVMLIFSLPSGRNILHCGDFRASNVMESYPIFWNKEIHTVHLDTTYCNPRYDFPTESESINRAVSIIQKKKEMMALHGRDLDKLLIVCGTYTIGKERFFISVAKELEVDVWAPADKNSVLKVAVGQDFHSKSPKECQLHVLPMGKIQYNILESYLKDMAGRFEEIVAFKPSGWELSKSSLVQRGNITIHGIPYSEHSSFSELQRFIKFLRPQDVIPTVNGHGGNSAMQKYFSNWLSEATTQKTQKRVSDYFNMSTKA